MDLSNLIKYYKSCYQEDTQGTQVSNIFAKSVESKYFFEDKDQIVNGFLPYSAIETDYAIETSKKVKIAEKEKELVYCSVFIVGESDDKSFGRGKISSPLFIYPAEIIQIEEDFFVKIDHEQRRVNYSIFNKILDDNVDVVTFVDEFYKIVGTNFIDLNILAQISNLFEKYSENIDTSELLIFPEIVNKRKLQATFNRKKVKEEGKFYLLPASAMAVIKKSVNTRGIINELTAMSESEQFSAPIKAIFNNLSFQPTLGEEAGKIPAILNQEQEELINTSSKFPFTFIIGPPGTGKSYTISALAIEKMSKGKSVLIASGTDKAVDIIAEKIKNQLKLNDVIVRAGRKIYRRKMIYYMNKILRLNAFVKIDYKSSVLKKQLKKLEKKITKAKQILNIRIKQEVNWGKFLAEKKHSNSLFVKIKKNRIKRRNKNLPKHWIVEENFQKLLNHKNELVIKYIDSSYQERVRKTITKDRQTLKNLLSALKNRVGTTQEKYFASLNYESVFKVFPVWLVKMSDIYKVIPLFTEMFDYVIIDEATQSNIAQALPILQRGKKVIITGDPQQLRHFSFLSRAKQDIFKDKLGLNDVDDYITDYKNTSLLDVVSHSTQFGEQFVTLYEHFRSLPAIIRFSNKNFYENKLRIMTSKPGLSENLGVELVDCMGKRNKQGVNIKEAEIIISTLKKIIENEKNLGINIASSIGILSPFRDQVEYIFKNVSDTFSLDEIRKHKITINTAYGFQGDERDIMMLSFTVDNETHATAFRYLNKEDVFNVSITRARKMQYIFYSIKPEKLQFNSILRQYLESFSTKKYAKGDEFVTDDFLDDVSDNLVEKGFQTWKNFKIAGLNIELIAKKNNKTVGIDLIGFPGQFAEAFSIERYKMLTRAGIDMFPLPYSYWINDKEYCLKEIEKGVEFV